MRPPPSALPPWRLFFPLAAVWGAVVIVLTLAAIEGAWAPPGVVGVARWHAHEMIWGHVLAAFAGVLLTALPRWTGCAPIAPATTLALAAAWLCARVGALVEEADLLAFASPIFVAGLAIVAARRMWAASDRRDLPLAGLLALLSGADATVLVGGDTPLGDVGLRLGLAGMIAIASVMGGRVAPALTRHMALTVGRTLDVAVPVRLERATAVVTVAALAAWVGAMPAAVAAPLLAGAAVLHLARLAMWKGWTCLRRPSILALHLGYGSIALGFALSAAAEVTGDLGIADAARHAWGVGVFGLLCFAVQASVVRRHSGRPLVRDRLADLGAAALVVALVARLAGAGTMNPTALAVAALGWLTAATLLLAAVARRVEPTPEGGVSPAGPGAAEPSPPPPRS